MRQHKRHASSDNRKRNRGATHSPRNADGFTLVELMVVVSILGILTALLLAGVQAAREAARRVQCQNNLRQVGVALHNHVSTFGVFPSNGGYDGQSMIESSAGLTVTVSTFDIRIGRLYEWGVGSPGASPTNQPGSWAYAILPYIEQNGSYQQVNFQALQPTFLCSSRSRPKPAPTIDDDFGRYESGGWGWSKTDYAANLLMIPERPMVFSTSAVSDGLSNTIAVGEKAFDRVVHVAATWYWDEPIFVGGSQGTARDGGALVPDGDRYEYRENWGSAHKVVHFVRADGSVQPENFDINWRVFDALRTPGAGD